MSKTLARCDRFERRSIEHCHSHAQLLLGWRGVLDLEFAPGGEQLVLGLAAILPPDEHHLFRGGDDDCEILIIDLDTDDPCLAALEQSCTLPLRESLFATPRTLSLPPTLIPMVELATHQLKANKSLSQSALLNHQLAILFVSQLSELQVLGHTDIRGQKRLSATLLDGLIDGHLTAPPDNKLLADACHLSQSQLHLRCLRDFGVTPQQYVMNRRLRWARFWLRETQRPVSEIAFDLGFSGVSSFSRAYRGRVGWSPSDERKKAL